MAKDTIKSLPKVTRVEVIGKGREYVNMNCKNVQISMQDNERTIKIFLYHAEDESAKERGEA